MENIYAIYSYKFVENNDEGDWTQGEQVTVTDMDAAQDWFYRPFGQTQTIFPIQKGEGESANGETISCSTPEEMQNYFDSL